MDEVLERRLEMLASELGNCLEQLTHAGVSARVAKKRADMLSNDGTSDRLVDYETAIDSAIGDLDSVLYGVEYLLGRNSGEG